MARFVASMGQSGRGAKQQRAGPSAQRARRIARAGFRPALELLEDRTLMSAGALDSSFGLGGKATTAILPTFDGASAMALQTDGKIVLAGSAFGPTEQGLTPSPSKVTAFCARQ
jgi:hypothetical protein